MATMGEWELLEIIAHKVNHDGENDYYDELEFHVGGLQCQSTAVIRQKGEDTRACSHISY